MRVLKYAIAAGIAAVGTSSTTAQQMATYTPNPSLPASAFHEFWLGANWRQAWGTPVTAPVLNLRTFAGGLKPFREGGNQSRTLRFYGGDGKIYVFRSTRKFETRGLSPDIKGTPLAWMIQDIASALHPTSTLPAAQLQSDVKLLGTTPQVVILPDDPQLGEFRENFAGLMGTIEIRPEDENPDSTVTFGAKKISDTEKLLEELEQSLDHQLDAREYLTARLLNMLVGDTDRGADQWQFARFDEGEIQRWRPIARDHDYTFMKGEGVLGMAAAQIFPKLVKYRADYGKMRSFIFMTREFDRSHLVGLSREEWDAVVTTMLSQLTDQVIEAAVRKMPPEHFAVTGPEIVAAFKWRRDNLPRQAADFYELINQEPDIFASNDDDVAEIERHSDGRVTVRLFSKRAALAGTNGDRVAAFTRTFTPNETFEIRVYMQSGNDRVTVTGGAAHTIRLRVTGGAGNDELVDLSRISSGGTHTIFYDAHGANRIQPGPNTKVNTDPYVIAQPKLVYDDDQANREAQEKEKLDVYEERRGRFQDLMNYGGDFVAQKITAADNRYWGAKATVSPAIDYAEGANFIIGASHITTDYGFRRDPYAARIVLSALYATGSGGFGVDANADFRRENSNLGYLLRGRATQFGSSRFYGLGNDSELIDRDLALVMRDEVIVNPALRWMTNTAWVGVGPIARYVKNYPEEGSLADIAFNGAALPGGGTVTPIFQTTTGQVGAYIEGGYNGADRALTSGFRVNAAASAYPAAWDLPEGYLRATGDVSVYVPFGSQTLALRAAGTKVTGDFPLHDAAFLGGRGTLRGYRWNRFAGDTEVHGNAELRVPIARITLLTRGQLGAITFYDAGRVWLNGDSEGGWHTSTGLGLSFTSLNNTITLLRANGEETRYYVQLAMPF